ncbi:hypothetical protein [Streptomyces pseudogriseolus]|uniref:hypothetical protein n=1 Tax=Streptomyces pseudogriseolus TaxID=36817 RepID=UPI003FA233B8
MSPPPRRRRSVHSSCTKLPPSTSWQAKRLEKVMPEEIVAHTGEPDVEGEHEGIMRRPDVMVIFVYGEDVTIGEWTIPTDGLPRYRDEESGQA